MTSCGSCSRSAAITPSACGPTNRVATRCGIAVMPPARSPSPSTTSGILYRRESRKPHICARLPSATSRSGSSAPHRRSASGAESACTVIPRCASAASRSRPSGERRPRGCERMSRTVSWRPDGSSQRLEVREDRGQLRRRSLAPLVPPEEPPPDPTEARAQPEECLTRRDQPDERRVVELRFRQTLAQRPTETVRKRFVCCEPGVDAQRPLRHPQRVRRQRLLPEPVQTKRSRSAYATVAVSQHPQPELVVLRRKQVGVEWADVVERAPPDRHANVDEVSPEHLREEHERIFRRRE